MDINQELMPEQSTGVISISTLYPGAGANEVESSCTKKIDEAVTSQEGIDKLMSTSMENISLVTIQLKPSVDVSKALQDVQRKVNAIRQELPDDAKDPSVTDFRVSDIPIMTIGVVSETDETTLYDLVDWEIKPMLEQISGVGRVALFGGLEREIQVNLNEERLHAYGLSVAEVSRILITSNLDFPTGKIVNDREQVQIRMEGRYNDISDIENTIFKTMSDGTVIKTRDVAEVADTYKEVTTISRINGIPAIGITIQRSADANTVNISEAIRQNLERIEKQYAEQGIGFIIAVDNAEFTLESSRSVMIDLVLAIILVAFSMLIFLQSIRNSMFAAIAISLSLIATFVPMYLLEFSLNIMTLLALTLVIGILVDDAIVVLENIHRHMEMGKKPIQAAYDGVKEIGFTVVSITLVLIVVFVPISLTQGAISGIFRQFSLTIAIAVAFSLLVSFMVVPLLYSRFGKLEKPNRDTIVGRFIYGFENMLDRIARWFSNVLDWSLSHKLIVISGTFVLLITSIALLSLGFIGSDLAPQGDQGQFMVKMELPRNSTIEQTNMAAFQAENIIRSNLQGQRILI
jgi:HAE1 family hydrophobic/amphiphilic exporter-1